MRGVSVPWNINRRRLFSRAVPYGPVYLVILAAHLGAVALLLNTPLLDETGRLVGVIALGALLLAILGPLKGAVRLATGRRFYRDRYDYRSAVRALSSTLHRVRDKEALARFLVDSVAATMGLRGASFLLPGSEGYMKVASAIGTLDTPEATEELEGIVLQTRQKDFFPEPGPRHSSAALLVRLGDVVRPLGILALGAKASRAEFTAQDLDFIATAEDEASACLRNLDLLADVQEVRQHLTQAYAVLQDYASSMSQAQAALQNAYLGMANSLVIALESRDPYTRGHSERVAQLARRTGSCLGLGKEDLRNLELAGRLHDIGKVGIPDGILLKPSSLEPHERSEIQRHPLRSVEILMSLEFLKEALPIIESHHEWYDSSGYPHGLEGEGIPLGGRILAVCDAYDAMTSARAYRPPFSHVEALQRLREGAGTQWDAEVVNAFPEAVARRDDGVSW